MTTRPRSSFSMRACRSTMALVFALAAGCIGAGQAHAQSPPIGSGQATTEANCSFGMEKGQGKHSCTIPIPPSCVVASLPGTTNPWTTISKGGNTQCRFDEKQTDWKTRITGTCSACKTGHCSAQFQVRFDCSASLPPPPAPPAVPAPPAR